MSEDVKFVLQYLTYCVFFGVGGGLGYTKLFGVGEPPAAWFSSKECRKMAKKRKPKKGGY